MNVCIFLLALVATSIADEKRDNELINLLRDSNDKFSARMFSAVVGSQPQKSVVMSAYSVLTPLAQLSLAASGPSHDELLKAIGLPDDATTKEVFPLATQRLISVKGVELKTASKFYVNKERELNPEYETTLRAVFNTDIAKADFSKNEEAASQINKWVESQTNNRIKDLVNAEILDNYTQLVLVNALYFKGKWAEQFLPAKTHDRDFHTSKSVTTKVPMMNRNGDFKYGESKELDAKLLEIPYEGEETSLLIVLPNDIEGLPALQEKLKEPLLLTSAVAQMSKLPVDVYLPKFKIESTIDLKDILEKLDVKKIFTSESELKNMLKSDGDGRPIVVSSATQKAFIEVNEEGSEAAAGNAFVIAKYSFPRQYLADHPFVFVLRNNNMSLFNAVFHAL